MNDHPPPSPSLPPNETPYYLHRRFDRMARLVGDPAMERLFRSRVTVIGLGGVGSFAVEALVRSGIGHLTLVDFDRVCVTNTNRQLQALSVNVAKNKANVLAERCKLINPQVVALPLAAFYSAKNESSILGVPTDYVVDAIDNVTAKCHLLAACKQRGIPVVSSTGASGRMDPTRIQIKDLADTVIDPLAHAVRHILREKYGFPAQGPFGIEAIYSTEKPSAPHELSFDKGQGFRCVCPGGKNDLHSCEERAVIYGTSSFVTGAFGLSAASVVVRRLTEAVTEPSAGA